MGKIRNKWKGIWKVLGGYYMTNEVVKVDPCPYPHIKSDWQCSRNYIEIKTSPLTHCFGRQFNFTGPSIL